MLFSSLLIVLSCTLLCCIVPCALCCVVLCRLTNLPQRSQELRDDSKSKMSEIQARIEKQQEELKKYLEDRKKAEDEIERKARATADEAEKKHIEPWEVSDA